MENILAFDPGRLTGWAHFVLSGEMTVRGGTIEPHEWKRFLKEFYRPEILIVERYFVQSGIEYDQIEVTGILKAMSQKWDQLVVFQEPSVPKIVKRWFSLRKKSDIYQHEYDALAHIVFFLVKTRNWDMRDGRLKLLLTKMGEFEWPTNEVEDPGLELKLT